MGEMTVYGGAAFEESVSAVTATPSVDLGSRRLYKGEEYVYCYNAGGAATGTDECLKVVTGASGFSVANTSLTDVFNPAVGVAKNVAIPAAEYGWVMVKGFASVNLVTAMTADYKAVALGASGALIEAAAAAAGQTGHVMGAALGVNTGAGGEAYCFIKTGY